MKSKPKPVNKSGIKNVFCPHYRNCLDYAAKQRWQHWHCLDCPFRSKEQPLSQMPNIRTPDIWCRIPHKVIRDFIDRLI